MEKRMEVRNMNENVDNCNNENLTDRLPELSEREKEQALSHNALSWALSLLSENRTGLVREEHDHGLILQNFAPNIVRCIMVVDHPICFISLQQMKTTLQHLDAELVVGTFTVIRPYGEGAKQSEESVNGSKKPVSNSVQEIGMEVA